MSANSTTTPHDPLHAWREIPRTDLPKRSVAERVADFLEIYTTLDEETAREQAERCVQCPHPSCVEACPLGNRIPDWLALTAEGHFLEAAQLLQSSSCMGDLFSRLCTDPCESHCIIDGPGAPVSINAVERFLHRYGPDHGLPEQVPAPPNGRQIAVMDAGPCGLACAHELALRGYQVTIFDQHLLPGGLLINGVPAFKVERTIVEHRIQHLQKLGVRFELGVHCGRDITLGYLRSHFEAVFFGACAEEARPLTIPGAQLRGVFQGLTFLVQKNASLDLEFSPIDVRNRHVVVLGAGDTAMDCLRTALRCGARQATCLYRRDETDLPATHHEFIETREEGAHFEFRADPIALVGNPDGEVTAVRCLRTRPAPGSDPAPVETIPGTEFEVKADVVLVAFGYEASPFCAIGDLAEIAVDPDGRIRVDANLMTNVPGVFAGGTLVRGRTQVVETVRDARHAARAIDRFLASHR